MNHEILAISSKLRHHRALKDISEALEQKLSSSKDISEAHSISSKFKSSRLLPKGVYSKDDCGKLRSKD